MRVGVDVEAVCRKCGEVWHVVIGVVDGLVAQVECRDCGARHRYRAKGAPAAAPRRSPGSGAGPRRSSGRAQTPVVEADSSRPRRAFRASDTYEVGDRVVHASFGEGVVQMVKGAAKIEVLFEAGPKTLVHGRVG